MRIKSKGLILVLLVVGALLVTGGLPLLGLIGELSTNGVGYTERGVTGGSNANKGGDLLDSTAYVTSWTGGGNSEKIVIQGHYKEGDWVLGFPHYWYKVTLSVDNPAVKINGVTGTVWTSKQFDTSSADIGGGWQVMESVILTLTNPCSGSVGVELYAHINYLAPLPRFGDYVIATDHGIIRSGVGSVKVQNDVVEEGTDAKFYVETAFSHSQLPGADPSDAGWFLSVYNPTGTKVWEKTIPDDSSGTYSWPVPTGSYSTTSSNIYKAVLRNELINQDDDWLFAVGPGMLVQIPSKPTFKVIEGQEPFEKGDSITVRISAEKTYNPIMGFWVWVSYETSAGTTTEYLYEKAWFPATQRTGGAYADVTFAWPDSGNARLEASTADNLNLNSGMSEMKFTIYGGEDTNVEPPVTDYSMLILGIFLLLVAFILYRKAPIPKPFNLIIALGLVALGIYLMYPTLTVWMGG